MGDAGKLGQNGPMAEARDGASWASGYRQPSGCRYLSQGVGVP